MHLEQQMLSEQNELASAREHLGNRHPKVVNLADSIEKSQVYLASYHEEAGKRVRQINDSRLGDLLISMVQQKLNQTSDHETRLASEYNRNRQQAVRLQSEMEQASILEAEVKRLRDLNKTLLSRIENIDINQSHTDVRVEEVDEPTASPEPVSPNRIAVLLISITGGLVFGVTLVVLRDVLDDRFRSPDELKQELGSSVLAMVRQLPERTEVGIEAIQPSP